MKAELISAYTRREAIETGVLVDLWQGDLDAVARRDGFLWPIACTPAVFFECVDVTPAAQRAGSDMAARFSNVLLMMKRSVLEYRGKTNTVYFDVPVLINRTNPMLTRLKAVCGPDDDGQPCITIIDSKKIFGPDAPFRDGIRHDPRFPRPDRTDQMTDEAVDLLREILAELRAARGQKRLSHVEHLLLDRLFPALVGRYGNGVFTTKDLMMDPVFKKLAEGMTPRELGNLLSRASNQDIGGLTIKCVSRVHGAAIWHLGSPN